MKKTATNLKLLLLFVLVTYCSTINAEKYALIVAIGKYPTQSGWATISSDNDVPIIKSALLKQGFLQQNIATITNEQATKAGITNSFNNLIRKSQAGDIVVFHFSGHGQTPITNQ